ncbi:MAG: hypothetical protein ACLU0O_07150 [Collinsella sp.]
MGLEDRLVPSDFAGFTGECDFTDTKEGSAVFAGIVTVSEQRPELY